MAVIIIDIKQIEKYIKITPELLEKSRLMGAPMEIKGETVQIEITPNRPDLLSMQGYLRALKSFLGKEVGLKEYKINDGEKDYKIKIDKSVKLVRPFTACAIVKNLIFDDGRIREIIDLQEKLHATLGRNRKKVAIGIYPLEKITLPIRYEARSPKDIKFQPLGADGELNALQILKKHPTGIEYAHLLEGKDKFPIFIDSKNKILSMPPIINSECIGKITQETKEVFVECSGFDFRILNKTLNIIVSTLIEMGGKAYKMELNYEKKEITPDFKPETLKVNIENVNNLLGLALKEKDLDKLLPKMGYDYQNGMVKVPSWRTDILHEVDIIEDIAIAYGYDNIVPEIPKISTIGQEAWESKLQNKLSEILVGLGLLEISSYHLIKDNEIKLDKTEEAIEILDSKTEYKILRPNLLISALRIFAENKDNEYPQKIFEIGTVFKRDKDSETGTKENENLMVAISPANFTSLKQILNYIENALGIKLELKEHFHKNLIEGRTASISLNSKNIGYLGEVHPESLRSWSIKMPVAVLEISLDSIFKEINNPKD